MIYSNTASTKGVQTPVRLKNMMGKAPAAPWCTISEVEVIMMVKKRISTWLADDYHLLDRHIVGKTVQNVLCCTEQAITLLMDDGTVIDFLPLEDEVLFDIKEPVKLARGQR